ncbi:GPW/gp25 family protein [Solimonas soli]|uniref:GPW/gp25 family protein n=1 Tax=Solimonas soli TaxID=413479 RepID=UPI00048551BC|nr:GPW/gp25 family protein [Solimonas soli]
MGASIFGQSLSFPLRVGADGRIAWSQGEDNVRESIAVILKTEPGERIGLPTFGAGLGRFLFEPNTPATRLLIEERIRESLARWERRIAVESVDVSADPQQSESAVATIVYRLVATQGRERISLSISTGR